MKTVLITGASRGIGACMAVIFAQNDYRVIINYNKSENEAKEVLAKISVLGKQAIIAKANVGNKAEVDEMFENLPKDYQDIDVLINNAAISEIKMFCDITEEDWDNMLNVNLKGAFNCIKGVLGGMVNKKEGVIINVASMWGQVGASCEVHYSASKGGLIALTKALAKELGLSNIRVNAISPGVINTQMNKHLSEEDLCVLKEETPLASIGEEEDVANMALFLASSKAKFITGQNFGVNGGFII